MGRAQIALFQSRQNRKKTLKQGSLKSFIVMVICIGLSAFFTYFPITDSDIFWHLAAGREIIAQKHLLYTDPFSFTLVSPKWVDLHWLFQLLTYGIYCIGGLSGLLVFKAIAISVTTLIIASIFPKPLYRIFSAIATVVFLYYARYLICIRPILLTMAFMVVYLLLFEQVRSGRRAKQWLLLCIPIQIIWTNSQGLYPVGLFIIAAYWLENVAIEYLKKLQTQKNMEKRPDHFFSWVLVASCIACFANPYGISGMLLPLTLFGRIMPNANNIYSTNISENIPLLALHGYESIYRTIVFVSLPFALLLFIVNFKKLRIAHIILVLGFGYLAFNAVRNVPLFIVIIVPLMSYLVSETFNDLEQVWGISSAKIIAALTLGGFCFLAFLGLEQYSIIKTYPHKSQLSPFRFPQNICNYLKANPVSGEMYNDLRYGGYLIWEFYPPKKVFADTRLIIRPPEFFAEYLAIGNNPELFFNVADKFHITQAALPSAIFNEQHALIKALYRSLAWHLEFTDGTSFLFVKNIVSSRHAIDLENSADVNTIKSSINKEWKNSEYIRNEAMGHFEEMVQYMLSGS